MATALVTGASRGIGKAIALALAEAGYDLVISARTVHPGEVRDNTATVRGSDLRPLPGTLTETAVAAEAMGRAVRIVPFDLTDRHAVIAAGERVLAETGGVDVLVHNGRYIGPGLMDVFLDTPLEAYLRMFEAHCIAPILLSRQLLPAMLTRGSGSLVNITSAAAWLTPPAPAGQGGWGHAYAVGKAAGNPLAATLHAEFARQGLRAFNVEPGFVATERNELTVRDHGRELTGAAPPAAIGAVVRWLVTSADANELTGTTVDAQQLCRNRDLYPPW